MCDSPVCAIGKTLWQCPGLTLWAHDTERYSKPDLGTFIFLWPLEPHKALEDSLTTPTHKLLFSKASPSLLHSPQLFSCPVESISLGPLSLLGLLQSILPSHDTQRQSNGLSPSGLCHTSGPWRRNHFSCMPQTAHGSSQGLGC